MGSMGGVVGLLVLLGVVAGLAAVAPASALSVRTVMGRILVPMLVGIEPGCGEDLCNKRYLSTLLLGSVKLLCGIDSFTNTAPNA